MSTFSLLLARAEEDKSIDGLLILLNTVGGDVEAGLAIAEMIASMRKPARCRLRRFRGRSFDRCPARSCSRLFADRAECHHGHSPGAYKRHVHRLFARRRTVIWKRRRIGSTGFVSAHSKITKERLEELMLDTKMLVKDVGTMLDGPQAVEEGLIDEVGGAARALEKLNELMKKAAGTEN